MKCVECGGECLPVKTSVSIDVHGKDIEVEDVDHLQCVECGEVLLNIDAADNLQRRANELYKKECGLLTGREITDIRKSLGLSQLELEALIKAGPKTLTRWEHDRVIQPGVADTLLRILAEVPQTLTYLQSVQQSLGDEDHETHLKQVAL